jgi:hypothetical protein
MILEIFDPKLRNFFDQHPNCAERWPLLRALFGDNYESARILFLTEVLALIDKWREPTVPQLNRILNHMVSDGKKKTPGRTDAGAQRHRRTFGRAIPWLDARQQSQPPFHPARGR